MYEASSTLSGCAYQRLIAARWQHDQKTLSLLRLHVSRMPHTTCGCGAVI